MVDLEKLIPEIESRRNLCLFPERCLEVQEEEGKWGMDIETGPSSYWQAVQVDDYEAGSQLMSRSKKGGGVVRITWVLNSFPNNRLGKDSRNIIQNDFTDIHPDLKLTSLWTGIKVQYDRVILQVFLQYSPTKVK